MRRAQFVDVFTRACLEKWEAEGARPSELVMSEIDTRGKTAPRLWRQHRAVLRHMTPAEVRNWVLGGSKVKSDVKPR